MDEINPFVLIVQMDQRTKRVIIIQLMDHDEQVHVLGNVIKTRTYLELIQIENVRVVIYDIILILDDKHQ